MSRWKQLADRAEHLRKFVKIALVGKYTQLEDAYASVIKALRHAALTANHKLQLTYIAAADLEEETKTGDPVKYHEAWKALCEVDQVISFLLFFFLGGRGNSAGRVWCERNPWKGGGSALVQNNRKTLPWCLSWIAMRCD